MKPIRLLFLAILIAPLTYGQETGIETDTLRKEALNVYVDASSYMKQEIPFINYVRDIKVADVVIISTVEGTGSGGRKYTYFLEGQGRYRNMIDTLSFTSSPDETHEVVREREAGTLKMGLMRYVLKTPLAKYIKINFTEPISEEVSSDRWNNWVFRAGLNGFAFATESSTRYSLSSNLSARRITEKSKIELGGNNNLNLTEYTWTDDETGDELSETNRRTSFSLNSLVVRSLGEHWSAGFISELSGSFYGNYIAHFEFKPGIEYNIFPFFQLNPEATSAYVHRWPGIQQLL
ncbi:MAG: hypothetical protein R2727_07910 [Bacteroidales bacterium]